MATVADSLRMYDKFSSKTTTSIKKVIDVVEILEEGIKQFVAETDKFVDIQAKLNSINDGFQTTEELNKKISKSANRARVKYDDMVNTVTMLGTKAGDSFSSNDEMIAFSELMTKSFKIAGLSAQEQSSAMEGLVQGMAAGRFEGNQLLNTLNSAPTLAETMAQSMNVSTDKLKEIASQGGVTSEMLKGSLFNSADEINEQFGQLPMKFREFTTIIRNDIASTLQPSFQKFIDWLNSDSTQEFFTNIRKGMLIIANIAKKSISAIIDVFSFFTDHWSIIEPIIWGIIGALVVYRLETMKNIAAKISHAIVSGYETAAIIAMELAQHGLNAALALCPITWIIMGIVILIALFYAAVAAINRFTGDTLSATGLIAGAIAVLGAIVGNIFIAACNLIVDVFSLIWNFIAGFVEFFANVFNDPIGSIIRLFANFADVILGVIEGIASAIDTIFGSNLADTVSGWRSDLIDTVDNFVGEAEIKIERIDPSKKHIDRISYDDAWNVGYEFGQNIEEKIGGLFPELPGEDFEDLNVDSVGTIEDEVDISDEDISFLRDLATMEAVNNYSTLAPNIKVEFGDVKETADVDKVAKRIGEILDEQIAVSAELSYSS